MHGHDVQSLRELAAPARNNYFYGKMLGVMHFELEQAYFNRKRWLLNRLGLGAGVLCGLEVEVLEGGTRLAVRPGVAIDGLGREIVVPGPYCLDDPRQPTDSCGRPAGDRIAGAGVVTLLLCYHECEADPVPVLVGDCDARDGCAPNLIRERFRLQLVAGERAGAGGLSEEQCAAIFPEDPPEDFDRREAACVALRDDCAAGEECIPLAIVRLPGEANAPVTVETCPRPAIHSNQALFDLIMCLAARVDGCCGGETARQLQLRYVSGDAQSGAPGSVLADPLAVEVVDGDGNTVANEAVTFTVRGGGGAVSPASIPSDATGRAETRWTIGPAAGLNTLAASIAGAPELTLFALGVAEPGEPTPTTRPPVILRMFPDPAQVMTRDDELFRRWLERPVVALTFDREMDEAQLRDPGRWLRVHQFLDGDRVRVSPVELELIDITNDFEGRRGFTAVWQLRVEAREAPAFYVVQARAETGAITDTSAPPLTLDAEFAGTSLTAAQQQRFFEQTTVSNVARSILAAFTDTGAALPRSGDGNEGGNFHAWFQVNAG